ncbi:MAG: PAS domain S-box protein, partial [Gallionella sp.]|nr:PAS domain S-box protein [Gallionella sp.]
SLGYSRVYEKEFIRKDGAVFPVEIKLFLLKDEKNQPEGICAIVRDVSERKRAEEELSRFFSLVPDLVCIASTDGHFVKINAAWQKVLGYTEQEILALPFLELVHPDDRDVTMREVERQLGGEPTMQFVNRYRCKDGSFRWLEWRASPAVDNKLLFASARDITGRRQTEELLQKSTDEIADLYNHAPCGYHSLDKDGNIRLMNDTELSWLGYTRDEVIGKIRWPDLLTPAGLLVFQETFPQLMRQGYVRDLEVEITRKDGTAVIGLVNASAIYDSGGNFVMSRSTIVDITARKRAEQRLKELSSHLQTVREDEKTRIAHEIHDDLGGTLTALKMDVYWIKNLSGETESPAIMKRIDSIAQLIDNAVGVTRRVITELRPTILDDLGLLAALEWQAAQFQMRTGIACSVHGIEGGGEPDKQYSIVLYRVFQEALTNIAKHSGASKVVVDYQCCDEEVMLSVSDNGSGLPEGHAIGHNSYGLRGINERVEQLGGTFSFNSISGGGFNVTVTLPAEKIMEEKS